LIAALRVVFLVIAFTLAAGPALAAPVQPDAKRAGQSFAIGKSAFARGDFSAAGAAFEQAALYAPHPATSLNAAEAWELAGELVRAAEICERVLALPQLEPRYRDVASEQLNRIQSRLARLELKIPPGARGAVDGEREENLGPGDHKINVMPGTHVVTAKGANGETKSETIKVAAGESKTLEFPPFEGPRQPEPGPKEPPPVTSEKKSLAPPVVSWIAFGTAAAGATVATIYGIKTVSAKDDFDASPTEGTRDDFNSARLVTNVSLGVAAVALAVGVVLWIADR
jgi:hypothetical protein